MGIALIAALALAPLYWLFVPAAHRRLAVTAASLAALGAYDWRLLVGLVGLVAALHGCLRLVGKLERSGRLAVATAVFGALTALFLMNKLGATGGGALPSQGGLVFLGVSYLVLKAAAIVADTTTGAQTSLPISTTTGSTTTSSSTNGLPCRRSPRFPIRPSGWKP